MPLYEYACAKCKQHFDEFMPVGSEPPACPTCKGKASRVWTVPATEWNPPDAMLHRMPGAFDGPGRGSYTGQ